MARRSPAAFTTPQTDAVNGSWAINDVNLADGTYTAIAEQSDASGNDGKSAPVTFTVGCRLTGRVAVVGAVVAVAGAVRPGRPSVGGQSGASKATCRGLPVTQAGSSADDTIYGTPGADVIATFGGNDKVFGLAGDDLICGGSGDDSLHGGAGDDDLFGRKGNDNLGGGPGTDLCKGARGDDRGKR